MPNETHDPGLRTWVPATAQDAEDFPIQNLPFGRFVAAGGGSPAPCVAIGDAVLDLGAAVTVGALKGNAADAVRACADGWLNGLMALPAADASRLRLDLSRLLRANERVDDSLRSCLHPRRQVTLLKPVDVRNYADFFTSIHHARNSGRLKRPDNPLLPNFHSLPVAYHGRASTLVVSGTSFARPWGQYLAAGAAQPVFAPSAAIDFECELGIYVGRGNALGQRIPLEEAGHHVFGFSLLNDWSARDVQQWESAPLGPFLAKSFLSTLSPWVVTLEAMAPFRIPAAAREADAPRLLPHLSNPADRAAGGLAIDLEVRLLTQAMRQAGMPPVAVSRPRFKDQYWTPFQMLTHQTSNGCKVEPGDLLGSGTISGADAQALGCLMEMTLGGSQPITLANGERRSYLADGDEVRMSARCAADGYVPIGFGPCSGTLLPAA